MFGWCWDSLIPIGVRSCPHLSPPLFNSLANVDLHGVSEANFYPLIQGTFVVDSAILAWPTPYPKSVGDRVR